MIFFFFFRKTDFMNPCITAKKNGHNPLGRVRIFLCRGTVRFAKLRPLMRLPEVFCSLPTSRSEKVPFSAVSTNPIFAFAKTGFMNPCIAIKKRTRPIRVCPYDFLSGVRCAPAFFERCGRFTKNCVCSRLHSPQRLTRLCGCCDEPHFCFAKTGFMNPCITAKKKRTRPVRVCPYDFLSGVRCVSQNFDR